jgi:ceramide glucosyltransferase
MANITFLLAGFALVMHLIGGWALWRVRRRKSPSGRRHPSVSILKPVCRWDDRLEENLESFFRIDYPNYELVFCTAAPEEPALALVRRLCQRYPHVRTKVVVGTSRQGLNPKVRVLARATPQSSGELIVVSDSNVRVRPQFLRETVPHFDDDRVAVVSNLVAGVEERTVGAALENLQLNAFIAPAICFGLALGIPACVVGKSMVLRRSDLEAIGGWESMSSVLAEDFLLGRLMTARGRKAVVSPHVVETVNETWSLRRFLERHDRWLKMRWRINPFVLSLEGVSNMMLWLTASVALAGGNSAWLAAATILCLRVTIDFFAVAQLRPSAPLSWRWLWCIPLRDVALFFLWLHARFSRAIQWRGGEPLLVGPGTVLSRHTDSPAPRPAVPVSLPDTSPEPLSTASRR